MRLASNTLDDDEQAADNSQFSFGVEPIKLETINILRDLIDLSSRQPQTAHADQPKSTASH